jgi:hypothetical protein
LKTRSAPSREAVSTAIAALEARAHFDAPMRQVHIRTASHDSKLYVDLCDAAWRAVEIDAEGWRIVAMPPVRFIRAPGMLALPAPVRGGHIERLCQFVNIKTLHDFILLVAYMLAALRDRGPYPILVLRGEERAQAPLRKIGIEITFLTSSHKRSSIEIINHRQRPRRGGTPHTPHTPLAYIFEILSFAACAACAALFAQHWAGLPSKGPRTKRPL